MIFDHTRFYGRYPEILLILALFNLLFLLICFGTVRRKIFPQVYLGLSVAFMLQSFIPLEMKYTWIFGINFLVFTIISLKLGLTRLEGNFSSTLSVFLIISFLINLMNLPWSIWSEKNHPGLIPRVEHSTSRLPNVYHFVFDRVSSITTRDFITENSSEFAGFVFYPRAATSFGTTIASLASIIRGRLPETDEGNCDYIFGKDRSPFFEDYKKAGYQIVSHQHFLQVKNTLNYNDETSSESLTIFKKLTFHLRDLYGQLILAYFPYSNSSVHFRNADSNEMRNGLVNLKTFLGNFADSKSPKKGIYYLIYNQLPHPPYILDDSCQIKLTGSSERDQRHCFQKLVLEIVKTLKKVHQDNPYYLVIHSDHGESKHRASSFLLSNIFSTDKDKLVISPSLVNLVDLVPSIQLVILQNDKKFLQFPLGDEKKDSKRTDYFLADDFNCKKPFQKFTINSGHPASTIPNE